MKTLCMFGVGTCIMINTILRKLAIKGLFMGFSIDLRVDFSSSKFYYRVPRVIIDMRLHEIIENETSRM